MKKFVTTRGCNVHISTPHEISLDFKQLNKIKSFSNEDFKLQDEILEDDSGVETCDTNEDSTFSLEKLSLNSIPRTEKAKCFELPRRDSNNNFETLKLKINDQSTEVMSDVRVRGMSLQNTSLQATNNSLVVLDQDLKEKFTYKSCYSSNSSLIQNCKELRNRKFIKRHEAMPYCMKSEKYLRADSSRSLNQSSPSLNTIGDPRKHPFSQVPFESNPLIYQGKESISSINNFNKNYINSVSENSISSNYSINNVPERGDQIYHGNKHDHLYRKSKIRKNSCSILTLPRKYQGHSINQALKRKWYSNESLSRHLGNSKLPEIVEQHAKDKLTSNSVSLIQSKYLGAANLPETVQDIFLLSNLLKRFASCDPPDKTLTLEEFKAKRIICKRAIRNFTINIKNAILNYESQSFVDSCRLSCCLSYADVVSCTCLLLDYLSMSIDRNTLALKVSLIGSSFCRAAILANSSHGKHSSEKSSKVFFDSAERLIQNLNDLTVHVGNLRQHSVSRKF